MGWYRSCGITSKNVKKRLEKRRKTGKNGLKNAEKREKTA
jgi:hypothetical protein